MLDRNDLEVLLHCMQHIARGVDPEMARTLLAEPSRNPDDPFLFEYLDRFIAALMEMIANPYEVGRRELRLLLHYVRRIRVKSARQWDGRPDDVN
ncbi:MAG TPA: hypothetical protein VEO54_09265 [Thermoanaerobaculia bacterium]|nr:hypothetical protein [Thermoanaerobaculia bacterium]